jgi:hypothetical protein
MWMFYASVIGFTIWMAGLGVTVAGDNYAFNLMLLAVGAIMQRLAMIAILVAQNAQGSVQDKQVEYLHDLGMTTTLWWLRTQSSRKRSTSIHATRPQ